MRQFLKFGMIVTAATILTSFGIAKPASAEPQGLSKSYVGAGVGGAINVPTDQQGNVWYVFQLDTRTGILKWVNVPFATVPRASVQ